MGVNVVDSDGIRIIGDSLDTVRIYLHDISKHKLLTSAEEVELAKRIEAGLYASHLLETAPPDDEEYRADLEIVAKEGEEARQRFISSNLRLVVKVGKGYVRNYVELLDVVQDGSFGLLRAVEKFDYTQGNKFSTYAIWWIRQAIHRSHFEYRNVVHLPVHVAELEYKVYRFIDDYLSKFGEHPSIKDIAALLKVNEEKVQYVLSMGGSWASLNTMVDEEESGSDTLGDFIVDDNAYDAETQIMHDETSEIVRKAISTLPPKEHFVVSMKFGLDTGKPETNLTIAREMNVSGEYVRQLLKHGLDRIKNTSRAIMLRDAYLN